MEKRKLERKKERTKTIIRERKNKGKPGREEESNKRITRKGREEMRDRNYRAITAKQGLFNGTCMFQERLVKCINYGAFIRSQVFIRRLL